jgi:hypothetical protein
MTINRLHTIILFLLIVTLTGFKALSQNSNSKVWFSPNTGSIDMLDLFTNPAQWDSARAHIDVFSFNASHLNSWPCYWCDTNTITNLINVQAFSKLNIWDKDIAIAIAPPLPQGVYPMDCELEHQLAWQKAYNWTMDAINNVQNNGGIVNHLIIDEPIRRWYSKFFPNGGPDCQIDSISDIAAFVSDYINALQTTYPTMEIGQIILYPEVDIGEIKTYVTALVNLGTELSYIHLDVHGSRIFEYGTPGGIISLSQVRDELQELKTFLDTLNIGFGPILTDLGWNCQYWEFGQYTDKTYYDGAIFWIDQVKQAIGEPEYKVFQSWVSPHYSDTSLLRQTFPINLPDNDSSIYSHTRLILEGLSILNSPTVGWLETQQNLPKGFLLHQNYPNPFNPITTIVYGLSERTNVELKVFDILGREVISLVNEEQPAGYYEMKFDASSLPSGIYFYRLQAASFIETKKMVLMK